jgi:hypothetical protein
VALEETKETVLQRRQKPTPLLALREMMIA